MVNSFFWVPPHFQIKCNCCEISEYPKMMPLHTTGPSRNRKTPSVWFLSDLPKIIGKAGKNPNRSSSKLSLLCSNHWSIFFTAKSNSPARILFAEGLAYNNTYLFFSEINKQWVAAEDPCGREAKANFKKTTTLGWYNSFPSRPSAGLSALPVFMAYLWLLNKTAASLFQWCSHKLWSSLWSVC